MNLKHICVAAISLTVLSACGKWAKAKKQDIIAVEAPAFPKITDNVFALQNARTAVSYKSTMLILNPTGNTTQLAELIKASEVTRVKAADAKSFVGNEKAFDARYGDSGSVLIEIKQKQEELKKFLSEAQADAVPIPLADRQRAAADWFNAESAKLNLSPEDNLRLQSTFANYCDAKIVELAAHPLFVTYATNDNYQQRPSPNQLCESYYQERGYFQGESCQQGDYFSCLWVEGVIKSGSFPSQNSGDLTSLLKPIFDDKSKTDAFRQILMADANLTAQHLNTPSTLVKDAIYKKKLYFYIALQSGKPSIGMEPSCINLIKDPSLTFICGLFARTWKEKTAQSYITGVELNNQLNVVKDLPALQTISDAVNYFGQRSTSTGTPLPSNSDYLFHALSPPITLSQPSIESLGIKQDTVTAVYNIFLDKVFSLNPEAKVKKTALETELTNLRQNLQYQRDERSRLSEVASDSLRVGIRAANAGDIAFGFIAYRMSVTNADNLMRSTISFEGFPDQVFEGCFDTSKQTSIDCPTGMTNVASQNLRKASLGINPDSGRIDFSLPIDDPVAFGLGYNPKNETSPDYFMNLEPESIKGTVLRFELYPNRLQGSLDILTGKALFNKDGKDLYEAGISMWEE